MLVFRCFYTTLETSGARSPWLLFLKSSFGNGTTCMIQDFQIFRRTIHLYDEAVTANELGASLVLCLILMLMSVSVSKLFFFFKH